MDGPEDDLPDDAVSAEELSELLAEAAAAGMAPPPGVSGLLKPVSLASALRPKAKGPGNRRARRAARSRSRKG